jgi:hypothetical protein
MCDGRRVWACRYAKPLLYRNAKNHRPARQFIAAFRFPIERNRQFSAPIMLRGRFFTF